MEAAFFDLDKTVIDRASMVAFGHPLYRAGLISRRTIARAMWGHLVYLHLGASEQKLARMRESVLALTKGWEQARVRAIVAETLESIVEPIIYQEALDLIEEHRDAGRQVFIVSASPEEIVAPLARYLGIEHALASVASVDREGRYTGEMDVYAYGPFKAELMREVAARDGIDLAASYAYSDSYTDLPMLEAVGHPVVVNPDRPLLKAARERAWEVRSFNRPVRLRDRMPVPRTPRSAAVAGALAVTSGAMALLGWRLRSGRRDRVAGRMRPPASATRPAASGRRRRRDR